MGEPKPNIYLVIMAGGSGTRFWPKSTPRRPKQFLHFSEQGSLLQQTLRRFEGVIPHRQMGIVTTEALAPLCKKEVHSDVRIWAEPEARNTAPCIFWTAQEIAREDPNAVMVVLPADHYIEDDQAFRDVILRGVDWAQSHSDLVTIGIEPTSPETGYGYLKRGESLGSGGYRLEAFVEKPDLQTARSYLQSEKYFWNAGIFVWGVGNILKAFRDHLPAYEKSWSTQGGDVKWVYPELEAVSIDYGIMEKAKNVVCFSVDCGWNDLGNWTSLDKLPSKLVSTVQDNRVVSGDMISVNSKGNIIDAGGKLIALVGMQDCVVVESEDCILVAKKEDCQNIRQVVQQLKKKFPEKFS